MLGRTNTGGGGSGGLNFQVIGGTTAPSNPKENMIWVNTSTKITSYIFSATQPTAASGRVWISTGTTSAREFNALKKNGIQVYPISAKQYVSGAWVVKEAKTYQNGEWVDWINYLFNYGNQLYTWKTTARTIPESVWTGIAPTVMTNNDGSVTLTLNKPSNAAHSGSYEMSEPYDLTGKKSLSIKYSISNPGSSDGDLFNLTVFSNASGTSKIAEVTLKKTETETTLPFEGVSVCYIGIRTSINGWSGGEIASSVSMIFKELIVE